MSQSPEGSENPYSPPASPASRGFEIGTLMLVVALVAVIFGVLHENEWLGIALALASVPAVVRTVIAVNRKTKDGAKLSLLDKAGTFAISLGLVGVTFLASAIAFVGTCFPLGLATFDYRGGSQAFPWIIGGLVGVGVLVLMARWLWPVRVKPKVEDAPHDRTPTA